MVGINARLVVLAAAVALAACGQNPTREPAQAPPAVAASAASDPDPKYIGAPSADWQPAGDAILSDSTVRDVTFLVGDQARVEVAVRAIDENLRVQLLNNEGAILAETDVAIGAEGTVTGIATNGSQNRIRITRQIARSVPAPFTLRIRSVRST